MKVAIVGKKETFVPINVTVTFEARKEVVKFIESAREIVEQGYACDLDECLELMREELSKW